MQIGKYDRHVIEVIRDFTGEGARLNVSYNENKKLNVQSLSDKIKNKMRNTKQGDLLLKEYEKAEPQFGNTNVVFLENVKKNGRNYTVNGFKGDYKSVIALRSFMEKTENEYVEDVVYRHWAPIGLGSYTTTKDAKFLVSRRSGKVDVPDTLIPTPVGNYDQMDLEKMPTHKEKLMERAEVKAGFSAEDYVIGDPIGIFRDRNKSFNPSIMFKGSTPDLTARQAIQKNKDAQKLENSQTDKEIIAVDIDETKASIHIEKFQENYVGNGLITILYGLKEDLGNDWFDNQIQKMESKSQLNLLIHTKKFYDRISSDMFE